LAFYPFINIKKKKRKTAIIKLRVKAFRIRIVKAIKQNVNLLKYRLLLIIYIKIFIIFDFQNITKFSDCVIGIINLILQKKRTK
jgi:hypothetical protein